MMNIPESTLMGLDLSLNGTGLVIIDKNANCIDYLSFTTNKKVKQKNSISLFELNKEESYFKKINFVVQKIMDMVDKWSPIYTFIEGYSFGSNSRSVTTLAELQGCIKYELNNKHVNWKSYPPGTIKKFIASNGHAKKPQVQEALIKINPKLEEFGDNYDLFDAYAVSVYGLFDILYGSSIKDTFFNKIQGGIK